MRTPAKETAAWADEPTPRVRAAELVLRYTCRDDDNDDDGSNSYSSSSDDSSVHDESYQQYPETWQSITTAETWFHGQLRAEIP